MSLPAGPGTSGPSAASAPAGTGPQAAVEVGGLRLQIGGATILDGIDLTARPGELLGVIGPNGAGKTTLFNVLTGIVPATAGRVRLHGTDVTTAPVTRRARAGLGRSFQTSSLFAELTVAENVRIAAQAALGRSLSLFARPRPDDRASAIARQQLAAVGLLGQADRPASALSHGEQRK
ncbi:MAG TPA: ATP-binding cassette domain-containing protein, partial [Jatrophihabitans sp.]|nr:ATP-binding cassette domain-containing protein [Jatrophihabitans sp.]